MFSYISLSKFKSPLNISLLSEEKTENCLNIAADWIENKWGYLRNYPGIKKRKEIIRALAHEIYVLKYDKQPIGIFRLSHHNSSDSKLIVKELTHVYIDESFRDLGIGGRLVEIAKNTAKAQGADFIVLDTLNPKLNHFYKKHGAVEICENRFLGAPTTMMSIRLPEIAVVTGASRGIGHALVLELVSRGLNVIAIARNEAQLKKLKSINPEKISIIPADITTDEGLNKIITLLQNLRINFFINNAAIINPIGPLPQCPAKDIRKLLDTNLVAPILLTNALVPFFCPKGGRILNITSGAGNNSVPGLMAYCISKAGLNRWTDGLKKELPSILTTDANPGEVDTDMQYHLRHASLAKFPRATEFKDAKKQKRLISPAVCAKFLANVLLDTTPELFLSKTWNIRKDYQGPLPGRPIVEAKEAPQENQQYTISAISHFKPKEQNKSGQTLVPAERIRCKL